MKIWLFANDEQKKQHNFQICDGERNLCAGSLKICQTSPSKLARWAFILPCIVQCSHARSSWVVYICWMFIDNCVFDINLLQDATFVCVVSWPLAPWEELEKSKEYQFIKHTKFEIDSKVVFQQGYRVGWVKANSKAIQAIGTHVITHNNRCLDLNRCHMSSHHICQRSQVNLDSTI